MIPKNSKKEGPDDVLILANPHVSLSAGLTSINLILPLNKSLGFSLAYNPQAMRSFWT